MKNALRELAYKLVHGEVRCWTADRVYPYANLCFSVLRSKRGSGLPMFFLHGAASNATRYEAFFETTALVSNHTLLRMDLRNHGASEGLRPATLEAHAADVVAVLDSVGIDQVVLTGHSLGAHVAMYTAAYYPERVAGLVLIDPLVGEALTAKAQRYRRGRPLLMAAEAIGRIANALGFARTMPSYSLRREDELAQSALRRGGAAALKAFASHYGSTWDDLRHIHLADYARDILEAGRPVPEAALLRWGGPMLVMASRAGAYTDAQRLQKWGDRHSAAFQVLECLHWPLTECPDQVEAALTRWAASTI